MRLKCLAQLKEKKLTWMKYSLHIKIADIFKRWHVGKGTTWEEGTFIAFQLGWNVLLEDNVAVCIKTLKCSEAFDPAIPLLGIHFKWRMRAVPKAIFFKRVYYSVISHNKMLDVTSCPIIGS